MSSFQQVIVMGHLGGDPELTKTKDGKSVAKFNIAVSESWRDQNGEKHQETEWFRIVCFDKQADLAVKYLHKGDRAQVVGKQKSNEWTDKEGVKRTSVSVRARELTFVNTKGERASQDPEPQKRQEQRKPESKPAPETWDMNDIPF